MVRPKLEFVAVIWADQSQVYLEAIEKLQHNYLRNIIFFKYYRWSDYVTIRISSLREQFELISLNYRSKLVMIIFNIE